MECNRDEATRAKEIAENKLSAKDISGAKKFALKAQSLYPGLDGISQLLSILDVYVAAENKINGESDYYGILGVNPSADDDTVRKHYRKLALSLHPDKNKCVGADGAFKHISEAWSLLSDKVKRSMYDHKRNANVLKHKIQTQNGGSPAPPPPAAGQNGFYNFTKTTTTRAKDTTPNTTTKTGPTSVPSSSTKQKAPKSSFWTVCHGCKMQYEYLRVYLYQNLLCPNCQEPFLAIETPPPNANGSFKVSKNSKVRYKATSQKVESGHFGNSQWRPFSKATSSDSAAQAASMVQMTYERVKREREETQAALKREEALRRKKYSKKANLLSAGHLNSVKRKQGVDGFFGANKETGRQVEVTKDVLNFDIREQLMKKARVEITKKLKEWSSETAKKPTLGGVESTCKADRREKGKVNASVNGDSNKDPIEPLLMDVPDPDFHDFYRGRTERCFKEGQVWAAYDDVDGMPRYYALICKIISLDPFKIKICWLNSTTKNELGPFSGFAKAFGEFRMGKHETFFAVNHFSHKINFTKNANGTFDIYPRGGDVWALYRNWSSEWNEQTSNEIIHKYEIVQVDEYDEELGVSVTPLVKVAGFKSVFHRHINHKEARVIPENEIFRFSHQIPSYLLTGKESPNAPKGCRELDPAATPLEFLQVIADVKDAENIEDDDELLDKDCVMDTDDDESSVLAEIKEADNTSVLADVNGTENTSVLADVIINIEDDDEVVDKDCFLNTIDDSSVLSDVKEAETSSVNCHFIHVGSMES